MNSFKKVDSTIFFCIVNLLAILIFTAKQKQVVKGAFIIFLFYVSYYVR